MKELEKNFVISEDLNIDEGTSEMISRILCYYLFLSQMTLNVSSGEVVVGNRSIAEADQKIISFQLESDVAEVALAKFLELVDLPVIYFVDEIKGVNLNALNGEMSPDQAIKQLIADTGLVVSKDPSTNAWIINNKQVLNEYRSKKARTADHINPKTNENMRSVTQEKTSLLSRFLKGIATLLVAGSSITATAQDTSVSVIGRVQDIRTGEFLQNARVRVEDSSVQAFTDQYGSFTLQNVPEGTISVQAFYTGYHSSTQTIEVGSGVSKELLFQLKSRNAFDSDEQIYELDAFLVQSQYDATASAIHEQRFSESNIAVVDTEALGNINEGNVGEFVKFLPGISINYVAADVRSIEVRGMGDNFTNVTVDGNSMASASSSNMNRSFELEQVSLNNVERIEVVKVPTSDMPASSLGGSVNLVSKSAFERDGRDIRYNAYFSFNSEAMDLSKTGGPGNKDTFKIRPGLKFTYADVYNDGKLGLIVNYLRSNQFNPQHRSRFRWSFEDYKAGVANAQPVLRRYQMQDGPKISERESVNVKLDYKISENTYLLTSLQWNDYMSRFRNTNIQWDTNVKKTSNNESSAAGVVQSAAGKAKNSFAGSWRNKGGDTWHGDIKLQHTVGDLKLEAGGYWSKATNEYRSTSAGFFENAEFEWKPNGFIRFSDYGGNHDIDTTVTIEHIDAAGNNNPGMGVSDLSVYRMSAVTPYRPKDGEDKIMGWNLDGTYQMGQSGGITGFIKSGLKFTSQERYTRDVRERWYHTGPDGKRSSGDEVSGANFLNDAYAFTDPGFGFAPVIAWQDMTKAMDYYNTNTSDFVLRGVDGKGVNEIKEEILAAYAMGSVNLFNNRGTLTAGVRWEKTNLEAKGDRDDRFVDSDFDGMYSSINYRHDISDRLVGRIAFAQTIGRQNFEDLLPNISINYPDDESDGSVTANNLGLNPQQADNLDLSLEYYTDNGGVISVGYFHKEITDYMRDVGRVVTQDDINNIGLPSNTLGFDFTTAENAGDATVDGIEFNLVQLLSFIPEHVGEVSVFANGTFLDIEGNFGGDEEVEDLKGFVSETYNLGVSYEKGGFLANVKYTHKGRELLDPFTGDGASSIGDVYTYNDPLDQYDVDFEYKFNSNYVIYLSARNIGIAAQNRVLRSKSADIYLLERSEEYGVQWSLGIKGKF